MTNRLFAGIAAGALWNAANLWCLTRLLRAWLGSSPRLSRVAESEPPRRGAPSANRQVVGWLLVKFPLLYGLAFVILRFGAVSLIGFGVGFTLVLAIAVGWFAVAARRLTVPPSHGR